MPKVTLDNIERIEQDLYKYILGAMDEGEITQTDLSEDLGISQQMVSYRLKNHKLTIPDLLRIVERLNPDDRTLINLIRG